MGAVFENKPGRPVVTGINGAVSSGHPLASAAGLRILQQGGNAFDAAVAVAASLNVVEPAGSGAGGDSFSLVYHASSGAVESVNATGPAPNGATVDEYRGGIPDDGPRSISVPGAVSGWVTLVERWGRLSLADVLAPAIQLAEKGFPVTHNLSEQFAANSALLTRYPGTAEVYFPYGTPPESIDLLRQPDLANTFRAIAEGGHDAFYNGEIARKVAAAVQEAGGLLDEESLAAYRAEVTEAISIDYRGYDVFTPPPNSTGHVLLQELRMLEDYDLSRFEPQSPELAHLMIEMKKLAFADRERFNADPRYVDQLPDHLLTCDYARDRAALIDPVRARPTEVPSTTGASDDTTYFAVIDREGNVVSTTTSINGGFGSGFIAAGTGMLLNNRMRYWHLDPGHPNRLEPGKRVRHTVSPVIVLRDGKPALVIGTPGADGQVQTIFQVMVNVLDFGVNPQLAVEMPRWRSVSPRHESNYPHGEDEAVNVDYRFPASFVQGLRDRGHDVRTDMPLPSFGSCQLIQVRSIDGGFAFGAAADPRRDAYALAW
jgi:gamma-glutamyltranspeptidase